MRAGIRETGSEMDQLKTPVGNVPRKSMKRFMKLSQEKISLVQKLGIRGDLFVSEMMSFHATATKAKEMKMLGVPDPDKIKQEALEHDRICGGTFMDMLLGQM